MKRILMPLVAGVVFAIFGRIPMAGGVEERPLGAIPHVQDREPAVSARVDLRRVRLAGPFPAIVTDVIDGDTFEARVTVWLGHEVTTRVRILGIDAAEMGSMCREEQALAEVSRAALRQILGAAVQLRDVRFDKYGGRVLAHVTSPYAEDVGAQMLAGGYAIAYDGGRRQAWCDTSLTSQR